MYYQAIHIFKKSIEILDKSVSVVDVILEFCDEKSKITKQKTHTHPYIAKKLEPFIEDYVTKELGKEWKTIINIPKELKT